MKIFDISPIIRSTTPVFPGDQAFERIMTLDFKRGDHLGLSWIKSTLHIGAHADAPSHYHAEGQSIEQRDLSLYLGSCQVISAEHVGARRIMPEDIDLSTCVAPRLLFKTRSFQHQESFQTSFASLSPELLFCLHQRGVKLVGIDTPSVDPSESKALESHQALFAGNFAVLEGLDLDQVLTGTYTLIALPLRLEHADASPVRAILLQDESLKGLD